MILLFTFLSVWIGFAFHEVWYIYLLLLIAIFLISFFRINKRLAIINIAISLACIGLSFIKITHNSQVYKGMVYEVKDNYFLFNVKGEKLYVYEKQTQREIGDILSIEGNKTDLDFTTLESSFDFTNYLNKKGIYKSLAIKKVNIDFSTPIRLNKVKKEFLNKFSIDTKGFISGMLFSNSDESELNETIRSLHLGKFLSANGTYINVFLSLFIFILSKIMSKKNAETVAFSFLFIYLIFVFPRFSVIKISFVFILNWINKHHLNKKYDYLTVLSFSGMIFLTLNKNLALQTSFILGYTIPIVFYFIRNAISRYKKGFKTIFPLLYIYLFLIPFEISFYQSISILSPIISILFTPLFLLIAIVSLLCFFKLPLYGLVNSLTSFLSNILRIIKPISFEINLPTFTPFVLLIYYLLFFSILFFIKIRFKPIIKILTIANMSFMLVYLLPINNLLTEEVSFINVGQGDACLIRKQNHTILIDTGGLSYKDIAKDCLIPFLKKKRIYHLDTVITTHDDYDHAGALYSLNKNFKIKRYIKSKESFPYTYKGISITNYNLSIGNKDDENYNSLVLGFKIGKNDYLVMGDAPKEIENEMMLNNSYIPCDILKVGHHGSKTSSSYDFLKYLSPKTAIISVGKNNTYKLPNREVIDNLKRLNINIKRTDEVGTISYKNYIFNRG